jgi:vacuolar-type H+-ATPase subunit E/Vma4
MKSDIEKKIQSRVAAAFEDIIPGPQNKSGQEILKRAEELVTAVWVGKIYAALPKDKTTTPEYFLDAELEQFLNEAVEECHKKMCLIAQRAKEEFTR